MWVRSLSSLVATVTVLSAPWANAQPTASAVDQMEPRLVTIRGEREQKLRFEIHADSSDFPAGPSDSTTCSEPCPIALSPGSYYLKVTGPPGSDVRAGEIPIEIAQDSDLLVKTTSERRHALGLKVGIVGSSVAAAGGVALFLATIASMGLCTTDECLSKQKTARIVMAISLGVVAVGATTAVLGWVTFARNNAPAVEVTPMRRRDRPRLSGIGLLRVQSAWGVFAAAAF